MTPHRHWFHSYEPKRIPVQLADGKVVYSSGVGSVHFQAMLGGEPGREIKFRRVCYKRELGLSLAEIRREVH